MHLAITVTSVNGMVKYGTIVGGTNQLQLELVMAILRHSPIMVLQHHSPAMVDLDLMLVYNLDLEALHANAP